MGLKLRNATPQDLSLLQYWDEQPHVIASDPDSDWEWEKELLRDPSWREQLMAEVDGKPIGFLQIIDPQLEDSHYWGDVEPNLRAIDIWIGEADYLGQGWGTIMMQEALQRCFQVPQVTAVIIDPLVSNKRAHRFYQRIGFTYVDDREIQGEWIAFHRMERHQWQSRA